MPKTERDDVTLSTLYGGKIQVKFYENSHQYWIAGPDGKFKRKSGATTYIGIKDKSTPLGIWQQGVTLDFLMKCLDEGLVIDEDKAIEAVIQYELQRDEAADIGKEIHAWCEHFIRHQLKQKGYEKLPEIPDFPEAVTGVNSFMEWLDAHKVKFISTERVVYSKKHDFMGTLDFEAKIDELHCLGDFKSSNGLYNGVRAQTAAYAKADEEERGGGFKYDGRWAVRLAKYSEEEYMAREMRKREVKKAICRIKGKEYKEYEIKPYQVFESKFLDDEPGFYKRDFDAFMNCYDLFKWDALTDSYKVGDNW